jgi:prephenate dehydrogenase
MFGPNVLHLAGRNILLCDTGDHALTDEATGLFEDSGANLVRVPLARHDELMQYVLGLSHLTGMVFAEALVASGMELSELWKVAAPSFVAQARATEVVVRDNQDLYYEIQTENGATPTMLEGMKRALDLYKKAIEEGDRSGFKALMARGRDYFRVSHDTGME